MKNCRHFGAQLKSKGSSLSAGYRVSEFLLAGESSLADGERDGESLKLNSEKSAPPTPTQILIPVN